MLLKKTPDCSRMLEHAVNAVCDARCQVRFVHYATILDFMTFDIIYITLVIQTNHLSKHDQPFGLQRKPRFLTFEIRNDQMA